MVDRVEVRRCARCGAAAAVSVRDWQQSVMGMRTGRVAERDFRCQACGGWFHIGRVGLGLFIAAVFGPPMIGVAALSVIGGLIAALAGDLGSAVGVLCVTVTSFVFGVAGVVVGTGPWRVSRANPVVPDAAPPPLRYTSAEPLRRCSCGVAASCVEVRATRVNLIPMGVTWTYACPACGRRFSIASLWGMASGVIGSSIAAALFAVIVVRPPGRDLWTPLLCGGFTMLLALLGVGVSALQLVSRIRHPVTGA